MDGRTSANALILVRVALEVILVNPAAESKQPARPWVVSGPHRAGVAPALRQMTAAVATSAVSRWRRRDALILVPPLTLALCFLPIAGGVIGTVLPAFG